MAFAAISAYALPTWPTSPLPQSYNTLDYIYNFSYPNQNLICPPGADGCGGGFMADIANNPSGPSVNHTLTTVWCVDYQLNVDANSHYTTDITKLSNVTLPTDANVRYGNLTSSAGSPAWSNSVTDPTGIDGNQTNSAAYRYTLAAALVSQYEGPSPASFSNPSSFDTIADLYGYSSGHAAANSVNIAIQEAVWYITYNNDYEPGAHWPPFTLSTSGSACGAGSALPTGSAADNPMCWVQYAEDNANAVNTGIWGVVSGPADAVTGALLNPQNVDGFPSYQTFLVQLTPEPEPTYYVLLGASCIVLFVVSRLRKAKAKA